MNSVFLAYGLMLGLNVIKIFDSIICKVYNHYFMIAMIGSEPARSFIGPIRLLGPLTHQQS